jgi:IS5 family transposase
MDGELLRWLYHRLLHDPTLRRRSDCTYGDGVVLLAYFFAVMSDRSLRWASDRRNWPLWCRSALRLPSYSQLCKRLKNPAAAAAIEQLNVELQGRLPRCGEKVVDGKPLVVGGFSHDPDAHWGKVPDGFANGYKLHVVVDVAANAVEACHVTALNANEAKVLRESLVPRLQLHRAVLHGDASYDSNAAYHAVAAAGGRLLAPRRKPRRGLGHHPQHADRLLAIAQLEHNPSEQRQHKRIRNRVEQALAELTNLPFGLSPLPNFVRRLPRVRRWVQAKIMLYHLNKLIHLPKKAVA